MQRFHPFYKFQNRLMICIICGIILPFFLLSLMMINHTHNLLEERMVSQMQTALQHFKNEWDGVARDISVLANLIISDAEIRSCLEEGAPLEGYQKLVYYSKINNRLATLQNAVPELSLNITLIDSDNNIYTTYNRLSGDELIKTFHSYPWWDTLGETRSIWYAPHQNYRFDQDNNSAMISFAKSFKVTKSVNNNSVLIISVSTDEISSFLEDRVTDLGQTMWLVNDNGEIIVQSGTSPNMENSSDNSDFLFGMSRKSGYIQKLGSTEYLMVGEKVGNSNWFSICAISYQNAMREIIALQTGSIILYTAVLLALLLVVWFLAKSITRPLSTLNAQMKKVSTGNLEMEAPVLTHKDEIEQLHDGFYQMLTKLKSYMNDIALKEEEKNRAYVKAIRYQIAPHFLFNTLNAIKWDAYLLGCKQIGDNIANLGKLYEISMKSPSEYLMIFTEKDFITRYVKLMQCRHHNQVKLIWDLPEKLESCYILKFILQPIVENSFTHGFVQNKTTLCTITIRFLEQGEDLLVSVEDNGLGISQETLDQINCHQKGPWENTALHRIALENIHQRILLNYGSPYGLTVQSQAGSYTRTTIRLPVIREVNNETDQKSNDC